MNYINPQALTTWVCLIHFMSIMFSIKRTIWVHMSIYVLCFPVNQRLKSRQISSWFVNITSFLHFPKFFPNFHHFPRLFPQFPPFSHVFSTFFRRFVPPSFSFFSTAALVAVAAALRSASSGSTT